MRLPAGRGLQGHGQRGQQLLHLRVLAQAARELGGGVQDRREGRGLGPAGQPHGADLAPAAPAPPRPAPGPRAARDPAGQHHRPHGLRLLRRRQDLGARGQQRERHRRGPQYLPQTVHEVDHGRGDAHRGGLRPHQPHGRQLQQGHGPGPLGLPGEPELHGDAVHGRLGEVPQGRQAGLRHPGCGAGEVPVLGQAGPPPQREEGGLQVGDQDPHRHGPGGDGAQEADECGERHQELRRDAHRPNGAHPRHAQQPQLLARHALRDAGLQVQGRQDWQRRRHRPGGLGGPRDHGRELHAVRGRAGLAGDGLHHGGGGAAQAGPGPLLRGPGEGEAHPGQHAPDGRPQLPGPRPGRVPRLPQLPGALQGPQVRHALELRPRLPQRRGDLLDAQPRQAHHLHHQVQARAWGLQRLPLQVRQGHRVRPRAGGRRADEDRRVRPEAGHRGLQGQSLEGLAQGDGQGVREELRVVRAQQEGRLQLRVRAPLRRRARQEDPP
mmetsp:Transcript_77159/g.239763  ORF Transcript_77159/g.239763 Transcript_77159/m.239763 type:complete len:494 (+) Transcript_77159:141-1622(+)